MGKVIIVLLISIFVFWNILFLKDEISAHPDGATPFWYPAGYIHGFVGGCAQNAEIDQLPFTREMWPEQVKEVCGCILDGLRHSVTWLEMSKGPSEVVRDIVEATMPLCVNKVATDYVGMPPQ